MAELATIARPYAEALLKASEPAALTSLAAEIGALGAVAADEQMRHLADNPKVTSAQVVEVVSAVARTPSGQAIGNVALNLVRTVLENGRFSALPEIAAQFRALVDQRTGVSQAAIESAYPLDDAQLADLKATMEKRFGRRLEAAVTVRPELIGGVRVTVGDEVLDTTVRARLDQMRVALTA